MIKAGSDKLQDVAVLHASSEPLDIDERVKMGSPPGAPRSPGQTKSRLTTTRRLTRRRPQIHNADTDNDRDTEPEVEETQLLCRRRPQRPERPPRRTRLYRPSSPTESVNSDLELLANHEKLQPKTDRLPIDELQDELKDGENADEFDGGEEFDDGLEGDDCLDGDDGLNDDEFGDQDQEPEPVRAPKMTYNQQINEKCSILAYLKRHKKNTGENIQFDSSMTLEELRIIKGEVQCDGRATNSIKLMQQLIVLYGQVLEGVAKRVPWLNLDLTGFKDELYKTKCDYDNLLYEIHDLYGDSFKPNPVLMLGIAITGNAFAYSTARIFVKNMQQGMGIPPPPPPMSAATAQPSKQQQVPEQENNNNIDISGPANFNGDELLELCRQQAQRQEELTSNNEVKTSGSSSSSMASATGNRQPDNNPNEIEIIRAPAHPKVTRHTRTAKPDSSLDI